MAIHDDGPLINWENFGNTKPYLPVSETSVIPVIPVLRRCGSYHGEKDCQECKRLLRASSKQRKISSKPSQQSIFSIIAQVRNKMKNRSEEGQPERRHLEPAKPKPQQEQTGPPSLIEECISNPIAAIVCCVLIGLPTLAVVLVLLPAFIRGYTSHTRDYSPSSDYQSNSPYAPSARTSRDIDRMQGTAAEKASAKDAVRRFNEAAAKRGDRPTGL